jgi:choline transporter-like protein 2/4/5
VLVLSFFGFLCVFSKIKLAVAIIKTASIFVKDEILITLLPIFTALFTIGLWIWWIITAVYIYSTGTITSSSSLPFASVTLSTA